MSRSSLLVVLIVASTALFAVGVIIERSSEEGEHTEQVQPGAAPDEAGHEEKEAEGAGEEHSAGSEAAAGEDERWTIHCCRGTEHVPGPHRPRLSQPSSPASLDLTCV